MDVSFGKANKLKSRKQISSLFSNKNTISVHPVILRYISNKESNGIRFAVSVSKRNFKNAVDRNKIKRLLREAIRLNFRSILSDTKVPSDIDIMIIYKCGEILDYKEIENKIIITLQRLAMQYE